MQTLYMTSFGDFIRQEREGRGWTQTEFGAKIGINSSAVSRVEHGNKQLSANKLSILSQIFSLDIGKIKELYYSDKFAKEVYKTNCPETVFAVAVEAVKYLKNKNVKQSKIDFV